MAASEAAFVVLKIVGAVVLVVIGIQSLRTRGAADGRPRADRARAAALPRGLLTSFANPKLAVFFVALFPQFVPEGDPVLPATVLMAAIIVAMDLVGSRVLAVLVAAPKRAIIERGWARRMEARRQRAARARRPPGLLSR